jgi:hypothetical protein
VRPTGACEPAVAQHGRCYCERSCTALHDAV